MTEAPVNGTMAQEFRPFFEALAGGCISFPRCDTCGRFHWYPRYWCPYCGSVAIQWRKIDGRGTLYSWTTVHHAFSGDPPRPLPYIVGLVEFADAPGVRLITNIVGTDPARLFENMPLAPVISLTPQPTVAFEPVETASEVAHS